MARQKKATFITERNPFPIRLRELMVKQKISQSEMARHVGCTRQAISLYTTGQSTPDIDVLVKIADRFKVSCDYLLGLSGSNSKDVTDQAINERLGLSDAALKNIDCLPNGFGFVPKGKYLNMFFSNKNFRPFLTYISQYLEFCENDTKRVNAVINDFENNHSRDMIAKREDINKLENDAEKLGCKVIDDMDYRMYLLFEINEVFSATLDSVSKEFDKDDLKECVTQQNNKQTLTAKIAASGDTE